nr:RHS repeat-associated core domain-containing protein [Paracidovorax avenae]
MTQATRYAYDALGRRVGKADAFGTTRYLWDGDLMVHSQRGGKASLFIYEPGSFVPLATAQGTQQPGDSRIYWYQCDQIGAPLELTDAQGHIAWASDYKVWGEATLRALPSQATGTDGMAGQRRQGHGPDAISPMRSAAPPLIEQPFRFQGQQFDEETGLHYNRFRYYDPVIGRFLSQDLIGLLGGLNLFSYAPNPAHWVDPLGLTPGSKGKYSISANTAGTDTLSRGAHVNATGPGLPPKGGHVEIAPVTTTDKSGATIEKLEPRPADAATRSMKEKDWQKLCTCVIDFAEGNLEKIAKQAETGLASTPENHVQYPYKE